MKKQQEPETLFLRIKKNGLMMLFVVAFVSALAIGLYQAGFDFYSSVTRTSRVEAERGKRTSDFDAKYAVDQDLFFRALPAERQKAVRDAAVDILFWRNLSAGTSAQASVDVAYQDMGPGLTLEEASWLKKKGIVTEPRWPGYHTYRTKEGIFVLYPEKLLEDFHYQRKEDEQGSDEW